MKINKAWLAKNTFLLMYWFVVLYNFHRYIFKYNSEGTSPTYANTPLIWQIGKYLILFVLLPIFYSCLHYRKKLYKEYAVIYFWIFFVVLINILNFFAWGSIFVDEIEYCIWFVAFLPYCFAVQDLNSLGIDFEKILKWTAIILFISNLIAVANFYLFGRLPALAYEGGLVRFGSFWDDPNSFGIICVFFAFYFLDRGKLILSMASFANILITVSFASYLLCVAAVAFWTFRNYKSIDKKWLLIGLGLMFILIISVIIYFDKLYDLYLIKEDSVMAHLVDNLVFSFYPLQNSGLQFSENWYVSVFYNYFPFSIILWLITFYFFINLFVTISNREIKFFFFLMLFSMFFFSTLYSFPLNVVFAIILLDYFKVQLQIPKKAEKNLI